MNSIAPDVNAYGTYGRESALADYLEIQALRGSSSMSKEELADMIRDNSWQGIDFIHIFQEKENDSDDNLAKALEAAEERADLVFTVLRERGDILGDTYPFDLEQGRLRAKTIDDSNAYLRLLAISTCHAYGLLSTPDPKREFEVIVTEALKKRGFLASNIGGHAYNSPDFVTTLDLVGSECQLDPTPDLANYRKHAKDEGVDIIAHLCWFDRRPIHWVYIGQATCAKSDSWITKINEPSPSLWKNLLGLLVKPRSLLAVPHHIPTWYLPRLAEQGDEDRLILDRLRLSAHLANPSDSESLFVDAINSVELEVA